MNVNSSYRAAANLIIMTMLCTASNFAGADMPVLRRKPAASPPVATTPTSREVRSTIGETENQQYNSGKMSQQQIDECTNEIKQKQIESQSWGGDVNAVANRLGKYQKELFEGRCAGHPEAQAYLAGANKMLGYSGGATDGGSNSLPLLASSGGSGRPGIPDPSRTRKIHNPAADAKGCVKLINDGDARGAGLSGHGRFVNNCPTAIELFWCSDDECTRTRGSLGNSWAIAVGGGWPVSGQNIRWGACRGANSGGFDEGSQGQRYTCPNLTW